jgi:predicted HTH domain antitoxin
MDPMKVLTIDLPAELLELLGTEEEAKRDAKVALVLDLVRRGKLSRAKAAELLELPLWDLPALLAQYRIPWFDYPPEDLRRDLESLRT